MLVDSMTSEWDPRKYHDEYRDALMEWIEKKARAGGKMPAALAAAAEKKGTGKVVDMMDLLKKSIQQVARQRGKESRPRKAERPRKSGSDKVAGGQG
jgi:DNA end-binding protein Ku